MRTVVRLTAARLHTSTVSCHYDEQGRLVTAQAFCIDCPWDGPVRDSAAVAFADGADHEDGVEVTA